MSKYILQWGQTDIPLVLAESFQHPESYGKFDYVLITKGDKTTAFISEDGKKELYEYGSQLFDKEFSDKTLKKLEEVDKIFLDTAILKNIDNLDKLDKKEYLEIWKKVYDNLDLLCIYYIWCEGFTLASLDDEVYKVCDQDQEVLNAVLSNPKLADKYNFSDKARHALDISLRLGELKLALHHNFEPWIRAINKFATKIAKDNYLSKDQALAMNLGEFDKAIRKNNLPSVDLLNKRLKGVAIVPKKIGERFECLVGDDYEKWRDKMYEGMPKEITGTPTYPGKVKAKVYIHMGWFEVSEIPEDSVLVTGMTNPQIIPLLKRASAIVTDEGGLTCHAAIVSRELKVPCIVGTQNATHLLKTGDMVEVDADKGTVKKIK